MPRPLRILHLDTERTWRGGERQALLLARGLEARGHRAPFLVAAGAPLEREARAAGLEVETLVPRGELDPLAVARIVRLVRRLDADLLHAHTAHTHTLGAIAGRLAGVPLVVSRRVDFVPRRSALSRLKYRRGVARYVAITEAVRRVLVEAGVPEERVRVVPSGVEPGALEGADARRARRILGVPDDALLVGGVGHFADHKGFDVFVEASAQVATRPDVHFALVGQGERFEAVAKRARRLLPADRFHFPGFREDVKHFLAAFDVHVVPSRLEGLNTSLLDAMALGRPVIASRTGGIPEAVVDGETGLLVPPEDPAALAAAVLELLDDADRRHRFGAAGRRHVLERFTADRMVEGTLRVYGELLG